jgi:hypothetical protein
VQKETCKAEFKDGRLNIYFEEVAKDAKG